MAYIREQIRNYLYHWLSHVEENSEIANLISSLLHNKGKIFNDGSKFTWAEFYYYVARLFDERDESKTSQIVCSAAVELLLVATDILDDLADQDSKGEILSSIAVPQAINLSNILWTNGLALINEQGGHHSLTVAIQQLKKAAYGQFTDLYFTIDRNNKLTEADYFAHINQKSVSLTKMVFLMQHLPKKTNAFWIQIANYIGWSGQIGNDTRDLFDDTKNDLYDKKATLPIIKAIEASQKKGDRWFLDALTSTDFSKNGLTVSKIRMYIKQTGAVNYCTILSEFYLNKAIQLIKKYQKTSMHKDACTDFIQFLGGNND
ncbi:polyprenyl synthetase family protein [Sporolactobacillus sp. CPB3-1]|uniref:Polyprenyl synthetase family protein n=1 Tax=Sporolactobacillus mangiferae TaxID=2940498 RepID=A0ABT0MB33_9BACL|nr:polyprenyl synthetase family protein [Sporolactobacillus mangiferae]MCL1632081.1 polyprenyl synthetase family protein [Sporolactobacillus mangiferae]